MNTSADDATSKPRPMLRQRAGSLLHDVFTRIADALRMCRGHMIRYLVVIGVLQLVNAFAIIPAIGALFRAALASAEITTLTDQNLAAMLSDPVADLLLVAIAVIALLSVSLQFSAIIVMVNRQQSGLPLTIRGVTSDTIRTLRKPAHYSSPFLITYFFLLLPLGGLGIASLLMQGVRIPPFVTREFLKSPLSGALYIAIIGVVIYVNLRLVLTLPMLTAGGKSALRALGTSIMVTRKQTTRFALLVGVPILATALICSLSVETMVVFSNGAISLGAADAAVVASICIAAGNGIGFVLVGVVTVVIMHILVAISRERLGLEVHAPARKLSPLNHVVRVGVGMASVAVVLSVGLSAAPTLASVTVDAKNTVILAHRGFTDGGVENTLGALEAAAVLKPDFVEVDIQETKDHHFVASHDSNLLILAGHNVNIYDLTLAEVTALTVDAGGYTDTIPTMAAYLARAAELKVPLLVELKMTGQESPDFVMRFLAEMDASGTTEQNIYHSLNAGAVQELKQQRPSLVVGLTIATGIGAIPEIECDFFSVEQALFSPEFLEESHAQGKQVYVWTVNDEATIRDLLSVPVDGIVTDAVDLAIDSRELVAGAPASDYRVGDALSYLSLFR